MGDKDLDIDQFRNAHESSTEWRLRRQFLLTHRDKFTVDRLLCLASCYVNVECYGNRYPDPVMRQLRELMADLPHDDRRKVGKIELGGSKLSYYKRNEVKFVRSTEQSGSSTSATEEPSTSGGLPESSEVTKTKPRESLSVMSSDPGIKPTRTMPARSENTTSSHHPPPSSKPQTSLVFREELQQYKANCQQQQADKQLEKFYTLANHIRALHSKSKNVVEVLHMAADKTRILVNSTASMDVSGNYQCLIELDCVRVCVGKGPTKKGAKRDAFQSAIELLWKPHLNVNKEDPNKPQLESSDKPFRVSGSIEQTSVELGIMRTAATTKVEGLGVKAVQSNQRRKRKASSPLVDLSDFLIIDHRGGQNPISVLHNSANINRQQMQVEFLDHELKARCQVHIGEHLIADEMADSKVEAKARACDKGLRFLKTICWTIQTKVHENVDEADITRDQLLGSIESDVGNPQISDSNVGKKLLERMGWKGGGLGKEGNEGIKEPIEAVQIINRAGLGLQTEQGTSQQFLARVKRMIQDYSLSDSEKDLVFSPLFSKEERAVIHKEAQKMNLKSHSYGQGSQRYLVLSRRRTITQLFSHIQKNGGETSKYILIPPTSH